MPPTAPPEPFLSTFAIGEIKDANGKVIGKIYPTAEFIRFLTALITSLKSAS